MASPVTTLLLGACTLRDECALLDSLAGTTFLKDEAALFRHIPPAPGEPTSGPRLSPPLLPCSHSWRSCRWA